MPSTVHLATAENDERHAPAPGSPALWNDSYWFPIYDPTREIGVVLRGGVLANQKRANLAVFITHCGRVVHQLVDHALPLPAMDGRQLALGGLQVDWEKPLEGFRLRYAYGQHGFDLVWQAYSPAYEYPQAGAAQGQISQGGRVSGEIRIGGSRYDMSCLGHRDHTWGSEPNWAKLRSWEHLCGDIDPQLWFRVSRLAFAGGPEISAGCLWDGAELHEARDIQIHPETADGGTRQIGVEARFADERGRVYEVIGQQVLVHLPVQYGRTWLKDGVTLYRYGERFGYGIYQHGYLERD